MVNKSPKITCVMKSNAIIILRMLLSERDETMKHVDAYAFLNVFFNAFSIFLFSVDDFKWFSYVILQMRFRFKSFLYQQWKKEIL